ncbi:ATP synthase subunit alpha-like, partial [Entelurus aequoreus]|uniref:ATP synthase subunit alpha-like n=1 Tax=Entelurus aequoreus TaxID=161455 RepID=UPI002B1D3A78
NYGTIKEVKDGVVIVKEGLNKVGMSEMVEFEKSGLKGIVNYLGMEKSITVLGNITSLKVGDLVKRLNTLPYLDVNNNILGRVVDPLGNTLDGLGEIKNVKGGKRLFIEKKAPGIIERESVRNSLETGVKFLDSMIPIGLGQRELIIGDPKTGKTTIAIDTIINQKGKGLICVYVVIGQKQTSLLKILKTLRNKGCMSYTTIVMASAADSAVMQYLAPYSGCTIGEFFMAKGRDVLIVFDDLSKHAVAYRQMSLLLRRPPGREGYPGDVFYLHSRLLERSAKMKNDRDTVKNHVINGGSLTAFPIIETVDGDISAYIPTNVISITDGQVFLEATLFNQGVRPAISPGVSVSRVGGAAQSKVMKSLAGSLKLELAQYREIVDYISLGLSVDASTKFLLDKGSRLQKLMNQPQNQPVNITTQIVLLYAGLKNLLNDVVLSDINIFERKLSFLLKTDFFSNLLKDTIKTKLFDNVVEYLIYGLKITYFTKK